MQKKSTSSLAFFSPKALVIVPLCTAACSILTGTLLAFIHSQPPSNASERTLTFEERVAYQHAIEGVYWRHRIWPKENLNPKPPLDAVMSQSQLQKKVADYLRKSQALEDYWQGPITAEQLQAEMDRMAKHTKQPDVLRELFAALGNDPFVIAECLAKPVQAERLIADLSMRDKHRVFESSPFQELRTVSMLSTRAESTYTFPRISEGDPPCTDDTWTAISTTNTSVARAYHTSVRTGSEMIVWGGYDGTNYFNTGGRYNPATDSWVTMSTVNAPNGRYMHTAVWTGSEMIVWGGVDIDGNTGAQAGATQTPTPTPTVTPTPTPCIGRCGPTPRPHPTPHPRPTAP
jgi:hypothetical protein